ncbi:hypothetical protein ACFWPA_04955 [Rhodococcus sp. NPDC058505]|uniref:hypothetical protein n=1 Tax=Rhodococcus sp. NPDC058505 TaxID=3346531 RepID=UPI0036600CE5
MNPRYRDLEPDALHADAEILRSTAAVLRAHLLAQEQAVARVTATWTGPAAEAALTVLRRHLDTARADCARIAAAADTLDAGAELIREAHAARADLARRAADLDPEDGAHPCVAIAALTELFTVVDRVVEGVREMVELALASVGAAESPHVAAPPPVAPPPVAAPPVAAPPPVAPPAAAAPPVAPPAAAAPPVAPPAAAAPQPVPVAAGDVDALAFGPRRDRSGAAAPTHAAVAADRSGAELADAGPL